MLSKYLAWTSYIACRQVVYGLPISREHSQIPSAVPFSIWMLSFHVLDGRHTRDIKQCIQSLKALPLVQQHKPKKKSSIQNIKQGISSWQAFGYVLVRRWSPCSTQRKFLQICKRIVTCSLNLKNYIGNPPKRTKGRLKITNKTMNVWAHKIKKPR